MTDYIFAVKIIIGFAFGLGTSLLSFYILSKSVGKLTEKRGLISFLLLSLLKYLIFAILIIIAVRIKCNIFAFLGGVLFALVFFVMTRKEIFNK